ncbi:MAG: hypothetical protein IKA64_06200 [Clostridia bacterium]|nr:hypothetical protein [Clostridia bacterium]
MSRTTTEISCGSVDRAIELLKRVEKALEDNKYQLTYVKGEHVWKACDGFWSAERFVKAEIDKNGVLTLSGWVRALIGGEMELDGFLATFAKKKVVEALDKVKAEIA